MIQFPETAQIEWDVIADEAGLEQEIRDKIARATLVEAELEKRRVRHTAEELFKQELDADTTPQLEMFTLSTYQSNPTMAPADLIDGVMKEKGLCIVMGPSGSGKSTVALQMTHCLMTGDPFLGNSVQQINGAVGVLSYDQDASLTLDWMSNFPNVDPLKISVVNAHKRGNPLGVPSMRAQIASTWKAMGVEVVLLDSFGASFFGQDQNDTATTMAHYRDMQKFALTEVGARALMVISHSTAGSPYKIRGSTAHHDVADSILAVVKSADSEERTVRMVKYRQHHLGSGGMSHQMADCMIGAPDPTTHLVSLDTSAMLMKDMNLPSGAGAADMFPDDPDHINPPDTNGDSPLEEEQEVDL